MNKIKVKNKKREEGKSKFASLPHEIQEEVRRLLEMGDFRSAKVLYDKTNPV